MRHGHLARLLARAKPMIQLPMRKADGPAHALVEDGDEWRLAILPVVRLCAVLYTRAVHRTTRRVATYTCNRVVGHDGSHAVVPWSVP